MKKSCFIPGLPPPVPEVLIPPPENAGNREVNHAYRLQIIEHAARLCGCQTKEEIREFSVKLPPLRNPMDKLLEWGRAVERIREALAAGEKIVVFGDYDCDGVTSTVLMLDGLTAIGIPSERLGWFIPNRFDHGYGVTDSALKLCLSREQPDLLIVVDCGTNSHDQLQKLRDGGFGGRPVEAIVIDHHHLAKPDKNHPAFVLLNPTSIREDDTNRGLSKMCAAGLVFLFWEAVVAKLGCSNWDRQRAVILAGLATQADVVPLSHINRALVKHSINALASRPNHVLGLRALHRQLHRKKQVLPPVDEVTFGFEWGPCINACGRLDDALSAVELLKVKDGRPAVLLARECDTMNRRRINTHMRILDEADEQARAQVLNQPPAKVILAAAPHWNNGVVGIVAARLRERYSRPAFVCGMDKKGNWCGSGRSVPGYDIGTVLALAKSKKADETKDDEEDNTLIISGGGHPMAGGLRFTEANRPRLAAWLNEQCKMKVEDFKPKCEIFAPAEALNVSQWRQLIYGLQPFGRDNPWRPIIIRKARLEKMKDIVLTDRLHAGKSDRPENTFTIFAGHFTAMNGGRFQANWVDEERVRREWIEGRRYTLELDVPNQKNVRQSDFVEPFLVIDCWVETDHV